MNREQIEGLIRHILTVAGGSLVTAGKLDPAELATVAGSLAMLAGVAWSWWVKRRRA